MRAAIYKRVSRDEQVQNTSLNAQEQDCRAYATRHSMRVIEVCADDESGATLERPGLFRLRELARLRIIDVVIVAHLDRLHRNLINQITLRDELLAAGVEVHAVSGGALRDTADDRLRGNLSAAIAEYERERIRDRTMRGTRAKIEAGQVLGSGLPRYGYQFVGRGRDVALAVDEAQAAVVREIHERYDRGESVGVIVRDLSARAVPTWSDIHGQFAGRRKRAPGQWSHGTVYALLRDEAAAGVYWLFQHVTRRDRKVYRDRSDWLAVPCPLIIPRDLWERNQRRLTAGQKLSTRNMKRFYLLRGRIRCGLCGSAIIGADQTRRDGAEPHRYYRCCGSNVARLENCPVRCLPRDVIERTVWEVVEAVILNPAELRASLANLRGSGEREAARLTERRAELERLRDQAQAQIDRLAQAYAREIITLDDMDRQTRALRAQRADAERQLQELRASPDPTPTQAQTIEAFLDGALAQVLAELPTLRDDPQAQQQVLELIDASVVVTKQANGLRIEVSTPLLDAPAARFV